MPACPVRKNNAAGTAATRRLRPGVPGRKRLVERYDETDLRQRVKEAGGEWHPEHKLRRLPQKTLKAMGLEIRKVADA